MNIFNPDTCHEKLLENTPGVLGFSPGKDYYTWRGNVKKKLVELIGDMPEKVSPNLRIEYEHETDLFKEIRFVFTSEKYTDVPSDFFAIQVQFP